jgi:hypothetical protein
MRIAASLVVAVFSAMSWAPGQAQSVAGASSVTERKEVERPAFAPGDTWQYDFANKRYAKPGCHYTLTVERIVSNAVFARVMYPDGCDVSITTAYPVSPNSLQRFDLNFNHYHFSKETYPAFEFPLYVGKKWSRPWEWKLNGWLYSDQVSAEVEAIEKVNTPAGTFDAYRIRLVREYRGTRVGYQTQSGSLEDTFWYAPEVKNFVRRTYLDGGWANITRELVSFKVQQ